MAPSIFGAMTILEDKSVDVVIERHRYMIFVPKSRI